MGARLVMIGVNTIASAAKSARFGEQWLNQHQIGYGGLDEEDRAAIREFALLWSIFECQTLFGSGHVKAMEDYVDELVSAAEDGQRKLLTAPFIPHLTYFRDQFIDPKLASTNEVFIALKFQDKDQQQLVSHALIELNEETPELLRALLIIVIRIRDCLFSGLKWRECKGKQRDDLYHASKILMKAADMSMD